jgi:hypothetical protein
MRKKVETVPVDFVRTIGKDGNRLFDYIETQI